MNKFFLLTLGLFCLLICQSYANARVDARFIIFNEDGRKIYMLTPDNDIIYGNVLVGQTIIFDASSSNSMFPIDEFRWDFDGDGKYDIITNKSVINYTFQKVGIYNTTLLAAATTAPPHGDGDTLTRTIKVVEKLIPPTASFTVQSAGVTNDSAYFIFDASTSFSFESYIQFYSWDFDGNLIYDQIGKIGTTSARYTKNGYYTAILTVTNYDGLNDTIERVIRVDALDDVLNEINGTVSFKNMYPYDVHITAILNNNQIFNITVVKSMTLNVTLSSDINEIYVNCGEREGLFFFDGNHGVTIEVTPDSISKISNKTPGFEIIPVVLGLILVIYVKQKKSLIKKT